MGTDFCEIMHPLNYSFALDRQTAKLLADKFETITIWHREQLWHILSNFDFNGAIKKNLVPAEMARRIVAKII